MLPRPDACRGCVLDTHPQTRGFVPPSGPLNAPLLFLGEAAGEDEVRTHTQFTGAAGGMLNRLLGRIQQDRSQVRMQNCLSCRPPNNWLEGAPYQHAALQHCSRHREPVFSEGHPVVVALGSIALKTTLGLWQKGIRMEDFHGTVTRDPTDRFWVVPTFHPSYLQRGATHLFGAVAYDLQVALRTATSGRPADPATLVVDPSVDWFTGWTEQVTEAVRHDRDAVWLAVDIETPDKSDGQDEGELTSEDRSYTIVRVNFSVHPDEGITVPYQGPYIALIDRLLALANPKCVWSDYDEPRLLAAGHTFGSPPWDFMWAWHHLQSDLPRGLGFVSPFYSNWGAWKHLASSEPGRYAAIDGFQTLRNAFGIARDLESQGQWDCFARHTHALFRLALKPAQEMGVKIDRERLTIFIADLEVKQRRLLHAMQGMVPEAVRPLTPKGGLKRAPEAGSIHTKGRETKKDGTLKKEAPDPIKQELYAQTSTVVLRDVRGVVLRCGGCGALEVPKRHVCPDGTAARLELTEATVQRWFWQEPFNPDSPDQILAYLKHKGHKPGRAKKTGADSTDRETLNRLYRETKDPLYKAILDSRGVGKVKGTYGVGTLKRLDADDRVHPTPTFKPSTHRLSYVNPNITNVITDRQTEAGKENLAAGFRRCVTCAPETRLAEFDFAGIEAVLSGYFMHDAEYIRLAKLGVHAGLASHVLGRPYDPAWPDAEIAAYFKAIKQGEPGLYDKSKRTVHGSNYGLTEFGMVRNFPETFATLAIARKFKAAYATMCPALPQWHSHLRELAYKQNYLGGPGAHPFGYKHWFWSVLGFRGISQQVYLKRQRLHEPVTVIQGKYFAVILGEDAKRVVAFYPQSTAAGVLKEVMLRLFDPESPSYIGDAYYGRTPFRAPIHDSLLLEIPVRVWDTVVEKVYREMLRPIPELPLTWVPVEDRTRLGLGECLSIGVEAKQGLDWATMTGIPTPTLTELGVSTDVTVFGDTEEDEEDLAGLEVA